MPKDDKKTIKVSVDDEKDSEDPGADTETCPEGQKIGPDGKCVPDEKAQTDTANADSDLLGQIRELLSPTKADSKDSEVDRLKKELSASYDPQLLGIFPQEKLDSMCVAEKKGALKTLVELSQKKDSPIKVDRGAPFVALNPGKKGPSFNIDTIYNFVKDPMKIKGVDKHGKVI